MQPQIQYARTSDGVNIACCAMGDGAPLVFTSNSWGDLQWYTHNDATRAQVDAMAASGFRVIRYDGRGMGSSDRDVTDFSLEARLLDLKAVVDRMALDRFPLCGYGIGGPAAILYALRHPERLAHLVLVNSFASGSAYYDRIPVMRTVIGLRGMAEEQWEFFTLTVASAVVRFGDAAEAQKTAALFRSSMAPAAFLSFIDATQKIDLLDSLPDLSVPTLVVADTSGYVTDEVTRPLAARIPGARLVSTDDYPRELASFLGHEPPPRATTHGLPGGTAVILFADIVDSTAMTERIGDAAFRDRARQLDERLRVAIRAASGRPVEGKLLGDGVLAVFTSARQAIDAALSCAAAGGEFGLQLHLGIHAGDVIREGDNVYGGAVNIASRISGLSAPDELLVSATVRDLARTSAGVEFDDRGEHALKGVSEAVRVFAVRANTGG